MSASVFNEGARRSLNTFITVTWHAGQQCQFTFVRHEVGAAPRPVKVEIRAGGSRIEQHGYTDLFAKRYRRIDRIQTDF